MWLLLWFAVHWELLDPPRFSTLSIVTSHQMVSIARKSSRTVDRGVSFPLQNCSCQWTLPRSFNSGYQGQSDTYSIGPGLNLSSRALPSVWLSVTNSPTRQCWHPLLLWELMPLSRKHYSLTFRAAQHWHGIFQNGTNEMDGMDCETCSMHRLTLCPSDRRSIRQPMPNHASAFIPV